MGTGLRRVVHWRNRRWGWGQRDLWLYTDGTTWWLYARVGGPEKPSRQWKHPYPTEQQARHVARRMRERTEADGDAWSEFTAKPS